MSCALFSEIIIFSLLVLKHFIRIALIIFLATICAAPPVNAETSTGEALSHHLSRVISKPNVDIALISSSGVFVPGSNELIIVLDAAPGWHTYWKNPGDVGKATRIEWSANESIEFGRMQWPAPEKIVNQGIVSFGYHDDSARFRVDALYQPNIDRDADNNSNIAEPVVIEAHVYWLVCKEICLPGDATISLSIPVNNGSAESVLKVEERDSKNRDFLSSFAPIPESLAVVSTYGVFDESIIMHLPRKAIAKLKEPFETFIATPNIASSESLIKARVTDNTIEFSTSLNDYFDGKFPNSIEVLIHSSSDDSAAYTFNPMYSADIAPLLASANSRNVVDPENDIPDRSITSKSTSLFAVIIAALLGGLILNAMPCVFPVLSLKVLAFAESGGLSARQRKTHGIAYTSGIILSFLCVAMVLILLRQAGSQIGWGFQMQSPVFVALLVLVLFTLGLSLAGYIEFGSSLQNVGGKLLDDSQAGSHWWSPFFTGVLATVVATPCTAPFMGGAISYALTTSTLNTLLIFFSMGFGLALPFLVIAFVPALANRLPRPGLWMVRLKELFAFPIFFTALWLLWVFARQTSIDSLFLLLAALVLVTLLLWTVKSAVASQHSRLWKFSSLVSLALFIIVTFTALKFTAPIEYTNSITLASKSQRLNSKEQAVNYSAQVLDNAIVGGQVVFVNMTADWCITCKVNEKTSISSQAVQAILKQESVTYIKGDWTYSHPEITKYLQHFKREGVPLYVVYRPGEKPEILQQLLTPTALVNALRIE